MVTKQKWAADFARVVIYAFALVGFAGVAAFLLVPRTIDWCKGDGCSAQGWIGAVSGSLATIFALAAVVVAIQALRVQRKASEAELRAYMFTDRAEYDVAADAIEIAIRNCGATPALNADIFLDLQLVDKRDDDLQADVNAKYRLGVVGPDKYHTLDWINVTAKRTDHLAELHIGAKHICVTGWIDYEDIFGGRHRLRIQTALTSDGKVFRKKLDILRQDLESPI
ncbi:hypothetical protein [Rhizobium sp. BR 362]|uniref:hypothetical protein n=1 Tax=Rhizobium sp. BR 362 TaxID=3040670 RepID=UPI002F40E64F